MDIVKFSPLKALIWGSHGALSQILVPETITTDENIMARAKIAD